jgi:ADP-ribose pyrophosphatase YjhB (NUDIX family)
MTYSSALDDEIGALAQRFGAPLEQEVVLPVGLFDPVSKQDRFGEVCMVIRRPNEKLITAIKTFYPRGAYRLLTGGIHHGEPIYDALLRETEEETSLAVEVLRFLAIVRYRFASDAADQPPRFTTFAFLLQETGGTLHASDPGERLEAFREVAVDELPAMADYLANLASDPSAEIEGRWSDWGRFRSAVHRAVYAALTEDTNG